MQVDIGEITPALARLTVKVEIEVLDQGNYIVLLAGDSSPRAGVPFDLKQGKNLLEIPISIPDPVLWNPNGYGLQKLYLIKAELIAGDKTIDSKEASIGLRNVRLVQDPDPEGQGKSFYFEVNGRAVFAKGANYIPNDVFLNRVSRDKYEFIVKSAAEANMNMLRVWGGGIYENDLFYNLCDQYGIMVWQDFMFACAMYPGNDEFLENVRMEAMGNVKRLRNHPCIVLWCGNNEIEAAWGPYEENRGWGWKQRYSSEQQDVIWNAYDTLFHHILPGVVHEEDPGRTYWHSSPSAGMGQLASYESTSGDMHYWGVWHGLHPFSDFRKYKARFMSEYGFQSFPEYNSVKKYTTAEDHHIESAVMMSHQRSGIGNLRIRQYMAEDYHIPDDFEQFLYTGQLLQAEAIKMAIESHRSEMPYCMGSLYWQINDCWPVASWSGIDYYGRWKALHYFVKEAFKPMAIVSTEQNGHIKIKIVSDNAEIGNLKLECRLVDFEGEVKWHSERIIDLTSQEIIIPTKEILRNADPASSIVISELITGNEILDSDLHYFVKPKDLKLTDPQLKTKINLKGDSLEISITVNKLAKNVFLYADSLDRNFSDNYFDILPGKTVSVTIPKTVSTLNQVRSIKLMHLNMVENIIRSTH
jgi:beta-mannosidase